MTNPTNYMQCGTTNARCRTPGLCSPRGGCKTSVLIQTNVRASASTDIKQALHDSDKWESLYRNEHAGATRLLDTLVGFKAENRKLKTERASLIDALTEILRITPLGSEPFGIAALVIGELDAWPYAPEESTDAEVEQDARKIYESWSDQPGFVPWVDGGNSTKQDEARRIARSKEPASG